MPLDLKLKVYTANDCADLMIKDITGDYNPETNVGGWGVFNASADSGSIILVTTVLLEVPISETDTTILELVVNNSSIFIGEDSLIQDTGAGEYVTPLETSLKEFKLKISAALVWQQIVSEVTTLYGSYNLTSAQSLYILDNLTEWKVLEDAIYMVTPTYVNTDGDQFPGKATKFNNVCLTQQMVDELATSADFRCEDCDDTDVDQISVAYSLLETLKSI
jgi:hypothetical protein